MHKSQITYLQDILGAIDRIEQYTKKVSFESFKNNTIISDAVVRNLEIIGEATKSISNEFKKDHKEIEWNKIAGLRDILIHTYFSINLEIIWDIIKSKLPQLKISINKIIENLA